MPSDVATFRAFQALHVPGDPLVLVNAWDAGSALAVAEGGARAIATGSWSVAGAHGYGDGEALPLDLVLANAARIVAAVDLPVSIDIEGGYGDAPDAVAATIVRLVATGSAGCNLEDGRIGGDGLYSIADQAARIAAVAEATGRHFFVDARTDLFLVTAREAHDALLAEAIDRGQAYEEEGAEGFFAPGLADLPLIERLCAALALPVNVLWFDGMPAIGDLAAVGVARVSHGPAPSRAAMRGLSEQARAALNWR